MKKVEYDSRRCVGQAESRRSRVAFTLVELLVVVAIIALLATLLAPALNRVVGMAREAKCGSNLRRIGEAAALFSRSAPSGQEVEFIPARWPLSLAEYVDDSEDVFVCPEEVNDSGIPVHTPLNELVCVNIPNTGLDLEFTEGPFSVKLSDEQFQAANFAENRAITLPAYSPGSDPGTYWWVFEDAPTGRWVIDYEVAVRVTENADGSFTLRCHRVTGGSYSSDLIDKTDDRKVLVSRSQMTGGPDSEVILGGAGGVTSYGMNAAINTISDDTAKIMMLDYPWLVANPNHNWSGDRLRGPIPGIPIFARHRGKMNVLFTGDSVRLTRPDEINPADPVLQTSLWGE